MTQRIDIAKLRAAVATSAVIGHAVKLEKKGDEYSGLCPFHNEQSPSFTVNDDKGFFHCFGCGAHGDIFDFVQRKDGVDLSEAIKRVAEMAGVDASAPQPREQPAGRATKAQWEPVHPMPADAPAMPATHSRHGQPAMLWTYRNAAGEVIGHIARFNMPDGHKEVLPLTWCRCVKAGHSYIKADGSGGGKKFNAGDFAWQWLSFGKPRPLYGLDELARRPDAHVVVGEGEKCKDALQRLFPDAVAVSWPGGGKAVKFVDWSPLQGRKVAIWPDADLHEFPVTHARAGQVMPPLEQEGIKTAFAIADAIKELAAGVRIALPPAGKPDGWDAADAEGDGMTPAQAMDWLRASIREPECARAELAAADGGAPVIQLKAGNLAVTATEAEDCLLLAGVSIYRRAQYLVRPVTDQVDAAHGKRTTTASLASVTPAYLRDLMCRHIRFEKFDARRQKWWPADAPKETAETVLARVGEWKFLPVVGVITTPTLRPSGTILAEAGYDPEMRYLLVAPPVVNVKNDCTRDDALAALQLLDDLLADFPFVDGPSRSVALSALITPVVRGAFTVAPMHAARAPTAGTGKSYLFDIASAIATGQRCPVMAAGRTEEETEKRLGAALLAGQPIISIDNVNGELGGDALCQIIERPIVTIRVLGKSEKHTIEARSTVFATGNNLRLLGDMTRRVLLCTLDARAERPELREFKDNPVSRVLNNRATYIAAALTVVRAYFVAGRPAVAHPIASFEDWSNTVRSALMWLGQPDPISTMEAARDEDPELQALVAFLNAWADELGTSNRHSFTTAEVIGKAGERDYQYEDGPGPSSQGWRYPKLQETISAIAAYRGQADAKAFGKWLSRNKGKIAGGLRLGAQGNAHGHPLRWHVDDCQAVG